MVRGVIFDMDGLMFDTERMWAGFWIPALDALGLSYKEGLKEAARGTAGNVFLDVVRRFYGQDCDAQAIHDSLHREAEENFLRSVVPEKPGLRDLLDYLKEKNIPAAVASSSREELVRHHLRVHGLETCFSVIVSGGMTERSKPAPDIFLLAAEKLGVKPEHCLVLEDSYNGIRAGRAGGFITVMVPDLSPADDEMRSLYNAECADLSAVRELLEKNAL